MKALEDLTRQKTAFDQKFETDGKSILEAGFAEFFAANTSVAAVCWEQFTENCDVEYPADGVSDPVFKLVQGDDEGAEDEEDEGFIAVEDIEDPALRRACKLLAAGLTGHDDLFIALFGLAARVTVNRAGEFEIIDLGDEEDEDDE